jgi:hypothetical protein
MAKDKYDGVVEAVHYKSEGVVEWVRAYLRRGAIFSDHVLIPRADFVSLLKSGRKFVIGQRTLYLAGTFETSQAINLISIEEREFIVTGDLSSSRDDLAGVPII